MNADVEAQNETELEVEFPKQHKVLLHNDDFTTFEFVIELLCVLFAKNEVTAFRVTQAVHEEGYGVAGVYTREVAEQKAAEGMYHAKQSGYPLLLTVEPE